MLRKFTPTMGRAVRINGWQRTNDHNVSLFPLLDDDTTTLEL
jgi:hypothetical protein